MNLHEFLSKLTHEEKRRFAADCKCSLGHLFNICSGFRRCSAELAIRIEKRTYGQVKKEELAPQIEW